MKKTYERPTSRRQRIEGEALLISVSTATGKNLVADDSDGDAAEALVKNGFETQEWDW